MRKWLCVVVLAIASVSVARADGSGNPGAMGSAIGAVKNAPLNQTSTLTFTGKLHGVFSVANSGITNVFDPPSKPPLWLWRFLELQREPMRPGGN